MDEQSSWGVVVRRARAAYETWVAQDRVAHPERHRWRDDLAQVREALRGATITDVVVEDDAPLEGIARAVQLHLTLRSGKQLLLEIGIGSPRVDEQCGPAFVAADDEMEDAIYDNDLGVSLLTFDHGGVEDHPEVECYWDNTRWRTIPGYDRAFFDAQEAGDL